MSDVGLSSAPSLRTLATRILASLESHRQYLDDLDAVAADGDHGTTMVLAWRMVVESLSTESRPSSSNATGELRAASEAFASVGGSIGPLWGMAILAAARQLDSDSTSTIGDALRAGVDGLAAIGGARPNDKTMLDAAAPFVDAFVAAESEGASLVDCLQIACPASRAGAAATAQMSPSRGRAARLAGRSVGAIDAGAASFALIVDAVAAELVARSDSATVMSSTSETDQLRMSDG